MLSPKKLEDIADRLGVSFAWLIGAEKWPIKKLREPSFVTHQGKKLLLKF
jgi:hypothetical protein